MEMTFKGKINQNLNYDKNGNRLLQRDNSFDERSPNLMQTMKKMKSKKNITNIEI